jgi:flavodoxin
MNQISVVYATKTKHSKKLAEAIGKALNVTAVNVKTSPVPRAAELLFLVGGIYAGKSSPELIRYVEGLDVNQVKKVVLVTSSASTTGRKQPEVRSLLAEKGVEVLEEIACPGSFLWLSFGHPNTIDLEEASARAKKIAAGL